MTNTNTKLTSAGLKSYYFINESELTVQTQEMGERDIDFLAVWNKPLENIESAGYSFVFNDTDSSGEEATYYVMRMQQAVKSDIVIPEGKLCLIDMRTITPEDVKLFN